VSDATSLTWTKLHVEAALRVAPGMGTPSSARLNRRARVASPHHFVKHCHPDRKTNQCYSTHQVHMHLQPTNQQTNKQTRLSSKSNGHGPLAPRTSLEPGGHCPAYLPHGGQQGPCLQPKPMHPHLSSQRSLEHKIDTYMANHKIST
jgi:hypothetical protein